MRPRVLSAHWAQVVQVCLLPSERCVHVCVADRLAGAQEALQAAKQVAAEQDRDISQIEQDLQQHR
jgi:hypothetical protein